MTSKPIHLTAILVLTLAVLATGTVPAAQQTSGQQACLNALNKCAYGVAAAIGRDVGWCVNAAMKSDLPPGQTAQQCLTADDRGQVAKAMEKTLAKEQKACTERPDFGPTSGDALNAAVLAMTRTEHVFGEQLDAALGVGAQNPDIRACQLGVAKAMVKLVRARLAAFNACKKAGMASGEITDATSLAACLDESGGAIPKATVGLDKVVARKCVDVDVATTFPGRCAAESPATLPTCLSAYAECAACRTLRNADGLPGSCQRIVDGVATAACDTGAASAQSVARQWDEEILSAIRIDFPRPPIHARNLFHLSVAMWDAWAAYDPTADGYIVAEKVQSARPEADRAAAISFAAYRVIAARYAISPNAATSLASLADRMAALGYDPGYTATVGDGPAALGNRIGAAVLAYGLGDGSNEAANYADPTYTPVNEPLIVKLAGTTMNDPNRWQPLALDVQIGQNGIPIPGRIQIFVGPQWGSVLPFAANLAALLPSPPPRLGDPLTDAAFKQAAVEVIRLASQLTPDDGATMDISPASMGNNPLGTNAGTGYAQNPVTGQPYAPQVVKRGDFGRVLAEYWADGPTSETPPGHWNSIANYVSDHLAEKRIGGTGSVVNDLAWDVKLYLALNAAVHDAAVGCWGTKRVYDSARPISMIRYMGGLGQSSDPGGPSYHPEGLPLEAGLVEVITPTSSAPGQRHEALAAFVGEIAILSWPGEPFDPETQYSGVRWVRAKKWVPYQRSTFVTPPFAGYTSGHSTYSRSAAEVLTRITGTPYFPGGLGEFPVPQNDFLQFEIGPSQPLTLQWATYYDAADEAGISRLWGGIHIAADDFGGRIMGSIIGNDAYDKAMTYFEGTVIP